MKRIIKDHGDALGGLLIVALMIAFIVWMVPPFELPIREIGFTVAALASAYLALLAGEWLSKRESKPLRWVGSAFTGLSLVIMAALLVGAVSLVIWAKFSAPPSDCMQCD